MITIEAPRTPQSLRHLGWLLAGFVCLTTGTLGIVVPLLPTVDFYVMAAWCFSKGDPRFERWLMNHPRIGPLVRDWRVNRSLPFNVKCLSSVSLGLTFLWTLHAYKPLTTCIVGVGFCALLAYLWTRPSTPRRQRAAQAGGADAVT